ncbi:hypothetical protein P8452_19147 [Trifolium repens]|nr:hypothetical protein P8452_19147 [Trifolium repens]
MRKSEAVDMVTTYLGMAHADVETEFGKTGGMHLRFNCLQHVYVELLERCQEMEDDPESTLEEMTPIREMCVRAFSLAYMQQYMDDASDAETSQMAGYLSLVQGWIIEHFPTLGAWSYADNWNETMPRLAKMNQYVLVVLTIFSVNAYRDFMRALARSCGHLRRLG